MLKNLAQRAVPATVVGGLATLATALALTLAQTPADAAQQLQDVGLRRMQLDPAFAVETNAHDIDMALADPAARRVRTSLVRATALALVLSDSLPRPKCGAQWHPSPQQTRRLKGELAQLLHQISRHEAGDLVAVRAALRVLSPAASSSQPAAMSMPADEDILDATEDLVVTLKAESGPSMGHSAKRCF